jgi:hypothetical protein
VDHISGRVTPEASRPSRRAVVRTAAWAVPAVSVVTAAPAFAASGDTWAVTSSSWEGFSGGGRGQTSVYYMRFVLTVPTGVTVTNPTATVQFGLDGSNQIRAGISEPSGWSTSKQDGNAGAFSLWWGRFVFTRGTITGPATVNLDFTLNSLLFTGATSIGTIAFTSSNPDLDTQVFEILKSNAGPTPGYITSPPA